MRLSKSDNHIVLWRKAMLSYALTIIGTVPVLAQGVRFEDVSREHSTVAARANQAVYDNSKKYGAERVTDRERSEYQPLGFNAGNYLIFPSVDVSTSYNDNIFATKNDGVGGWRFEVAPSVIFSSRLPRHVLDLIVSARRVEFSNPDQEAFTDGSLYLRGRLDIDHGNALFGHMLGSYQHEELGSAEADRDARDPISYWRNRAEFGYIRDAGRLALRAGVKAEQFDYNDVMGFDGNVIDQDYRDRTTYSANLKLTYRFSPGYKLNTQFRVQRVENEGNAAFDRDSFGYDILTGVDFEFSPLWKFYLAAGFQHQGFEQANLKDLNAFVYLAQLQWLATEQMTIYLGAERQSSVTGFGDSSVRLDRIFDGKVEYEIWRNLILTATGKYTQSDFIGSGREDESLLAGVGFEYLANRNLKLSLRYDYSERVSTVDAFNYQGNKYTVGFKLQF